MNSLWREYKGDGQQHYEPLDNAWGEEEPYIASKSLTEAVNMALYLRRPLLLEGDPGGGKTRLAYAIAYELGLPLKGCYIRSTSRARDLLYSYDAIGRLYDLEERRVSGSEFIIPPRNKYVTFGKLGEAIKLSSEHNIPSVVLIDEIDKADIDFPNDLLQVLDELQFEVDEVEGWRFDALKGKRRDDRRDALPLFIITSNREKELPKPFLRRCLFYYIEFPSQDILQKIIEKHAQKPLTLLFQVAIRRFWELRDQEEFTWRKIPSTGELLTWINMLEQAESNARITAQDLDVLPLRRLPFLGTLVKIQSDLNSIRNIGNDNV